jgi:hypothetical protein
VSNPGTWLIATTDHNGYYNATGLWVGDYNIYADHIEYPSAMKSYVTVTGDEPARVDLILGQERALLANPSNLYITVEKNSGTYEDVLIDVSAGESTIWTAQSNVNWLMLGNAGETYEESGQTGLDGLILRFDPSKVAYGSYTTDVLLTAPDAEESVIQVTMSKIDPDSLNKVFLPMVGGGK